MRTWMTVKVLMMKESGRSPQSSSLTAEVNRPIAEGLFGEEAAVTQEEMQQTLIQMPQLKPQMEAPCCPFPQRDKLRPDGSERQDIYYLRLSKAASVRWKMNLKVWVGLLTWCEKLQQGDFHS